MKLLFIGDVYGRSGREALLKCLPALKAEHTPDAIIVNAENAAHGRGMTIQICEELYAAGVDCITSGDHAFDQREILPYFERQPRLIRPVNLPATAPGQGIYAHQTAEGKKILIVNLIGQVFMTVLCDNPFTCMDRLLDKVKLGRDADAIFVDFHAEATSEKAAMAHYLDGRVSAVVGTHTHVPTADARILPKGTAFQTDVGMTGDYNSVIGADPTMPIMKFSRGFATDRMIPAEGTGEVRGCLVDTEEKKIFSITV